MENKDIQIYGTQYINKNIFGDFGWMCKQKMFNNCLFIFNDNEEHHNSNKSGMGNAVVRKYNKFNEKLNKPLSAGIPTGTLKNGGYQELDKNTKQVINGAVDEIKELLNKNKYDGIFYSVNKEGKLGTGLFNVAEPVVEYIDSQIKSLSKLPVCLAN